METKVKYSYTISAQPAFDEKEGLLIQEGRSFELRGSEDEKWIWEENPENTKLIRKTPLATMVFDPQQSTVTQISTPYGIIERRLTAKQYQYKRDGFQEDGKILFDISYYQDDEVDSLVHFSLIIRF